MKLIALHRLYQRTCTGCGYHWTVTRAQSQLKVKPPHPIVQRGLRGPIGMVIEADEAAKQAQVELVEQFKRCAKCGADDFIERPVTKRHPADRPEV